MQSDAAHRQCSANLTRSPSSDQATASHSCPCSQSMVAPTSGRCEPSTLQSWREARGVNRSAENRGANSDDGLPAEPIDPHHGLSVSSQRKRMAEPIGPSAGTTQTPPAHTRPLPSDPTANAAAAAPVSPSAGDTAVNQVLTPSSPQSPHAGSCAISRGALALSPIGDQSQTAARTADALAGDCSMTAPTRPAHCHRSRWSPSCRG
jgi:hypothetical protein